jgi:alkylhydroperoxidase family enzyme
MPRISALSDAQAQPPDLVAAIRARRGGALLKLDRLLLHSPALARGWNAHLGAVRAHLGLDARLRELAICGVAVLNDAEYEFTQHAPLYLDAGGSEAALGSLRHFESACADSANFTAIERAVLRLTLEMTRDVAVSDQTFAAARAALGSDQLMVELVGVIATYNMVSRFLVALGVHSE